MIRTRDDTRTARWLSSTAEVRPVAGLFSLCIPGVNAVSYCFRGEVVFPAAGSENSQRQRLLFEFPGKSPRGMGRPPSPASESPPGEFIDSVGTGHWNDRNLQSHFRRKRDAFHRVSNPCGARTDSAADGTNPRCLTGFADRAASWIPERNNRQNRSSAIRKNRFPRYKPAESAPRKQRQRQFLQKKRHTCRK